MLFAVLSAFCAFFDGHRGCHCPLCCTSGILYHPCESCILIRMGFPLHMMSTFSSLCTETPCFVNTEIVPSSEVVATLISDVGNCSNVSACVAFAKSCGNWSVVMCFALLVSPFATLSLFVDAHSIGIRASFLSALLM